MNPRILTHALLVLAAAAPVAAAQLNEVPEELEGITVDQKVGEVLPLDLVFRDENGEMVKVGDYFGGELPVLVTLNYSACPQLCSIQLDTLVDGLREVDLTPGTDFTILTVSIDPRETVEAAARTKAKYVERYMRPAAADGWHFLTGTEANIQEFAEGVGFTYRWVESRQEYAHPPAVVFCTPEGRVARYLASVAYYQPANLKYSLVEASEGKIGDVIDAIFLWCFAYDPNSNAYVIAINV
ncbi:MAG: SCO family protein, partial [Planctomycetota bacterium JB042]